MTLRQGRELSADGLLVVYQYTSAAATHELSISAQTVKVSRLSLNPLGLSHNDFKHT